jgi:hypothetical protein
MMISDHNTYNAAKLMVENYGRHAQARTAERMSELAKQGDLDGADDWRAMLRAIEELQRERRKGEALN